MNEDQDKPAGKIIFKNGEIIFPYAKPPSNATRPSPSPNNKIITSPAKIQK